MSLRSAPVPVFGFLLILIASSSTVLAGKPISFLPSPGSINVPDDWSIKSWPDKDGNFVARAVGPDNKESLTVWVYPVSESVPLSDNSSCVQSFLKTCADTHAIVGASRHEMVNNLDFYVLPVTTRKSPSAGSNTLVYFGVNAGHIFQIAIYQKNGDPGKNPDYAKILASLTTAAH